MSTLALIDQITRDAEGAPLAVTPARTVAAEIIDVGRTRPAAARSELVLLPVVSRVPVTVREASLADLPFIDALQKKHSKAVGWMPTMQLEGKIKAKQVLIAEDNSPRSRGDTEKEAELTSCSSSVSPSRRGEPLGYVIGQDRYFKGDDVGIIYQMNVVPSAQRGLIGATLLKAMFERAAYGCRLFCCWCAQELAANRFWESMGFVPLAFRTGSEKKSRTHIFWQKRIRAGDDATPWWFPAQTSSGSIREDRLVLPIPPGMHWSDAKPMVLPGAASPQGSGDRDEGRTEDDVRRVGIAHHSPKTRRATAPRDGGQCPPYALSGLRLGAAAEVATPKRERREPRAKRKNDPALVAQARELRDRWLEHVAANPAAITAGGKYDVARQIDTSPATPMAPPIALNDSAAIALLPAA